MSQKKFTYQVDEQLFQGQLYTHPDGVANRPTILIYHAFEGMNNTMQQNANRIVSMGFNAITLDVYGEGKVLDSLEDCMGYCMNLINNRVNLLERLKASVTAARQQLNTNNKLYAIGFCFGGLCVLDLARSGEDLAGVVSVHGVLAPSPVANNKITAKILCCHGYNDPQIPAEQITDFMQEMDEANADWQFVNFGNTKHAFSDPEAHKIGGPEMGREYNQQTTERVWQLTKLFCQEYRVG